MTTEIARRARNRYFPESYYSMQADNELMVYGDNTALPPAMRMFFVAAGRVNKWGHCPFEKGELRRLVGCARSTLYSALGTLIASKIAAPESTMLCIVLNSGAFRRNDRAEQTCIEPAHLRRQQCMWVSGIGWEDTPGDYHALINDKDSREWLLKRTKRTKRTVTVETEIIEEARTV